MKNLKKIFCLVLSLCLLAGMLPAAFAEDAVFEDDYKDLEKKVLDDAPRSGFSCHTILGDSVAAAFGTQEYENTVARAKDNDPRLTYVYDVELIPGSYGALVNKALGIETTNMCAHCGWRTVDFVNFINWKETGVNGTRNGFNESFYTGFGWVSRQIDEWAEKIPNAVAEADLITLSFGSNDLFTYGLMDTLWNFNPEGVEIDTGWMDCPTLGNMFQAFAELLSKVKAPAEYIEHFASKCEEGLASFKENFPKIIDYIHGKNQNAKIFVLNVPNPVNFTLTLNDEVVFDIFTLGDYLCYLANSFVRSECRNRDKYTYVEALGASYYGLLNLDIDTLLNASGDMEKLYAVVKVVHPDEDGHAFIARKLIESIKASLEAPVLGVARNHYGDPRLTWEPVKGAVSYRVYRSAEQDSGYELIAATPLNVYTDIGADRDEGYWYKVVASMNLKDTVRSGASEAVRVESKAERSDSLIKNLTEAILLYNPLSLIIRITVRLIQNAMASLS